MIKKYYLAVKIFYIFCFLHTHILYGQVFVGDYLKTLDVSLSTGTTWFFGDVGGKPGVGKKGIKDWDLHTKNIFSGLHMAYNMNDRFGIRAGLSYTRVSDNDKKLGRNESSGRFWRNASFRSDIYEFNIGAQILFRFEQDGPICNTNKTYSRLSPYTYIGIGFFHFNPKTLYNNSWVTLAPLRTEGQGMIEYSNKPYKLTQFYLPFCFGFQYQLSTAWGVRAESIFRKTFTDYIDDVSTNYIDPKYFDQYLSMAQAGLAKKLYDRSAEVNNGVSKFKPGDQRGIAKNNDTYSSFSIGLVYNMQL